MKLLAKFEFMRMASRNRGGSWPATGDRRPATGDRRPAAQSRSADPGSTL